jgi:hypothetical protein
MSKKLLYKFLSSIRIYFTDMSMCIWQKNFWNTSGNLPTTTVQRPGKSVIHKLSSLIWKGTPVHASTTSPFLSTSVATTSA